VGVVCLCAASAAHAYPIDAYKETGIGRLEAYRLALEGGTQIIPRGAQYPSSSVQLRLTGRPDFTMPAADPALSRKLAGLLGQEASRYGVALLDLTDLANPRYAEHNATMRLNPGSVGKVIVALGFFQALSDAYADDVEARRKVLRDTVVTADRFIRTDGHTVPIWHPGAPKVTKRPLREGDAANLWTYLDWMCSASSNAAASMMQRELLLVRRFGREYPVEPDRARAYFDTTEKTRLQADLAGAIQSPVTRNGLDLGEIRQGSFFTREGKRIVPGTSSHATSRALMQYLVLLEQGKLVDRFSSLEIKRLIYLTDRRIRYASAPALRDTAVYFKSGSLYSCQPEAGFTCKKYHGNVKNYMNSIAIVETPDRKVPLHYMVVVMSNVLRKNSAVAHQTLATRIHRLIESFHPIPQADSPSPSS
jgi:hypothetical protein